MDGSVIHEGHGTVGKYVLANGNLNILWNRSGFWQNWGFWSRNAPEIFKNIDGIYIQQEIQEHVPEIHEIYKISLDQHSFTVKKLSVAIPGEHYEVSLRLRTSDVPAFQQAFVSRDFDSANLPASADRIVDLGANVGLAAVFFALRYPRAHILAVEPDGENFAALCCNTRALGDRVQAECPAASQTDGVLHTMAALLDRAGFGDVDILKVDIDGGELALFAQGGGNWLERVALIIVETHDRSHPGSDAAVRVALTRGFEELPSCGENLFFRRRSHH